LYVEVKTVEPSGPEKDEPFAPTVRVPEVPMFADIVPFE